MMPFHQPELLIILATIQLNLIFYHAMLPNLFHLCAFLTTFLNAPLYPISFNLTHYSLIHMYEQYVVVIEPPIPILASIYQHSLKFNFLTDFHSTNFFYRNSLYFTNYIANSYLKKLNCHLKILCFVLLYFIKCFIIYIYIPRSYNLWKYIFRITRGYMITRPINNMINSLRSH